MQVALHSAARVRSAAPAPDILRISFGAEQCANDPVRKRPAAFPTLPSDGRQSAPASNAFNTARKWPRNRSLASAKRNRLRCNRAEP